MFEVYRRPRALAPALLLLLSGCVHLRPPERGGPPWWRMTTPHFTLLTDVPRDEAEASARSLEQLRAAMLRAGWDLSEARLPRMTVVAFRSTRELRAFADDSRASWVSYGHAQVYNIDSYGLPGLLGELMEVVRAEERLVENEGVITALAAYTARPFPRQLPWWVSDGLASFLAQGESRGQAFVVGQLSHSAVSPAMVPAAVVRDPGRRHVGAEQATALVLVHFLRATQPRAFGEFLARLARGEPEESAFEACFPGLDNQALDAAVSGLRESPRDSLQEVPFAPFAGPLSAEELSPSEVHATWALLHLAQGPGHDAARGEADLREALALDPRNVTAQLLLLRQDTAADQGSRLRGLADEAAGDPRPCQLLVRIEELPVEERLACAERVLAVEPDDLPSHSVRARALIGLARLDEASAELGALELLAGPDLSLLSLLAKAQAEAGQCPSALATGEKLERAAGGSRWGPQAQAFVRQVRTRCAPAGSR